MGSACKTFFLIAVSFATCFWSCAADEFGLRISDRCTPWNSDESPEVPRGFLFNVSFTKDVPFQVVLTEEDGGGNNCGIVRSGPIAIKPQCDFGSTVLIPWLDALASTLDGRLPVKDYHICTTKNGSDVPVHVGANVIAEPVFYPVKRLARQLPLDPVVSGLRVESGGGKNPYNDERGVASVLANEETVLRLFGHRLDAGLKFKFAFAETSEYNESICDETSSTRVFTSESVPNPDGNTAFLSIRLPDMPSYDGDYYMCIKKDIYSGGHEWILVGTSPELRLRADSRLLPVWVQIVFITVLLILSGLFSGLNLGLMALDRTDLKILCNTGSEKEKRYAKKVMPVRRLGNYLLCSLLLGNVLVNSSLTLLLDDLTSGLVAVIGSTMGIVIFGEIIPQAICSRHGLAIGAWTVWITKIFMAATFPLSYPISKVLDKILGEEIGNYYNRERLKELVKITNEYNDLERDEVNIISGALDLKKKTVMEIMTKLDDVFMLSYEAVLDFATMSEIRRNGYSRIPVYQKDRCNIVGVLYVKDLVLMDPDDDTPLKTLCDFYQNPCFFTFQDTTLDVIFRQFKEGDKGHLAFIQQVIDSGEKDPFYEVIGIVTLEDVIEEMIQAEIVDETDVFTDNRTKKRLRRNEARQNMSLFMQNRDPRVRIAPQLALAALQYLSTSVEAFKPSRIAERILRQLMKQDIFYQIKVPKSTDRKANAAELFIYQRGKPEDYFVLILEGRAEVIVGSENMIFEAGPFTCFGMKALGFVDKDDVSPADWTKTIGTVVGGPVAIPTSNGTISRSGSQQLNSIPVSQSQDKVSPNQVESKKAAPRKPTTLVRNGSHKIRVIPPNGKLEAQEADEEEEVCDERTKLMVNNSQAMQSNLLSVCSNACPHWNSCPSVFAKLPPPSKEPKEEPIVEEVDDKLPEICCTFVPDYSVKAITDLIYIRVRCAQYIAARRATLLFQKQKQENSSKDDNQLESEAEKIWKDAENSAYLTRSRQASTSSALSTPSAQRRTSVDLTIDTQPPSPSMPVRDATATSDDDVASVKEVTFNGPGLGRSGNNNNKLHHFPANGHGHGHLPSHQQQGHETGGGPAGDLGLGLTKAGEAAVAAGLAAEAAAANGNDGSNKPPSAGGPLEKCLDAVINVVS